MTCLSSNVIDTEQTHFLKTWYILVLQTWWSFERFRSSREVKAGIPCSIGAGRRGFDPRQPPTHEACLLSAVGDLKWSLVPFFLGQAYTWYMTLVTAICQVYTVYISGIRLGYVLHVILFQYFCQDFVDGIFPCQTPSWTAFSPARPRGTGPPWWTLSGTERRWRPERPGRPVKKYTWIIHFLWNFWVQR